MDNLTDHICLILYDLAVTTQCLVDHVNEYNVMIFTGTVMNSRQSHLITLA